MSSAPLTKHSPFIQSTGTGPRLRQSLSSLLLLSAGRCDAVLSRCEHREGHADGHRERLDYYTSFYTGMDNSLHHL
ncbi:hypothetical protein ATANTOWER_018090 [Ataeniobius toweri]|uniref:Uncharacterized protein n=1 Tax=Ataeniobius toweri TaxID=208326 RepID=A0ABU7C684_9TELE|nr:hypothetical protein [Ataeniobius toweri]